MKDLIKEIWVQQFLKRNQATINLTNILELFYQFVLVNYIVLLGLFIIKYQLNYQKFENERGA